MYLSRNRDVTSKGEGTPIPGYSVGPTAEDRLPCADGRPDDEGDVPRVGQEAERRSSVAPDREAR